MQTPRLQRDTPLWPVILAGALAILIVALQAGAVFGVELKGNDDMMRLQQVRDLLTGTRGWFDVSQERLVTPEGGAMHWSRLPDIFIGAMVLLLQPLIGTPAAETVAITVWPLFQLGWVLAAAVLCLRRLGATLSGQLAGLFFFCTSFALVNFIPGRIDHHGFGLALTLTAFACLLSPTRSMRSGLVAGLCVAAMLTIAIENLPAAGLILGASGLAWIVRGKKETRRLRGFAAALIVGAVAAYCLDAPGVGRLRQVCDAYGQSHFAALLVAGAGLGASSLAIGRAQSWQARFVFMALAGLATLVAFVAINPSCLGDPYSGLGETVRTSWLSSVGEARSMPAVLSAEGWSGLYYYGFGLAGLACALFCALRAPDGLKLGRVMLLGFCLVGFILSLWQLRASMLSHAFASIACGLVFGLVFAHWLERRGAPAALLLFAVAILISPAGWKFPGALLSSDPDEETADCTSAQAWDQIASVPAARVFTPIDLGAPLIYRSRHEAMAAPYHRNPQAIDRALAVFKSPSADARSKLAESGAAYLLTCNGLSELALYAETAPGSLAAALESGQTPDWLTRVAPAETEEDSPVLYSIAAERN